MLLDPYHLRCGMILMMMTTTEGIVTRRMLRRAGWAGAEDDRRMSHAYRSGVWYATSKSYAYVLRHAQY